MALTVTREQLRDQIRERCAQDSSTFRSDASVNTKIDRSIRIVYGLLIKAFGQERFLDTDTIATVSGTETYALPADYFATRGVDIYIEGEWRSLQPYMYEERNNYQDQTGWTTGQPVAYRRKAGNISLLPIPDAVYSVKHHYYPTPAVLSLDSSTFDGILGWDEWVVCDVASQLSKEEGMLEEAVLLTQDRDRIAAEIRDLAGLTDVGGLERSADVCGWPCMDDIIG